ncbi:MAG: MaoC family dehydratase [Rhizobiaceae bacterium]
MSGSAFFDLLKPDMRSELGSHLFEAGEIIRFAEKFDPQRFHLSDELAKDTIFGRLCASGWMTASLWMKYNVSNSEAEMLRLTGHEGPGPELGPSPGMRNLKWPAPVYVGDTISYYSTVTGTRKLERRPGWGLLTSHNYGVNQDGKLVFSADGAVTVRLE